MNTSASRDLSLDERVLYHQVHPLKIGVDVFTMIVSAYLLAEHELVTALLVMWGPSILISVALVRFGDFSKIRDSSKGEYLRRYMTRAMQGVRLAGAAIIAVVVWLHEWLLIPFGVTVIGWGWLGKAIIERVSRSRS